MKDFLAQPNTVAVRFTADELQQMSLLGLSWLTPRLRHASATLRERAETAAAARDRKRAYMAGYMRTYRKKRREQAEQQARRRSR